MGVDDENWQDVKGNEKGLAMSTDEMTAYLGIWSLAGFILVGGMDVKLLCVFQGQIGVVLGICKRVDAPFFFFLTVAAFAPILGAEAGAGGIEAGKGRNHR